MQNAPEVVLCRFCRKPMQIAEDVKKDERIVTRRFICTCRGIVFNWNWHAGNTLQDKP